MARLILLDSGLFGMIVCAPGKPQVVRCLAWLKTILAAGAVVVIPEIRPTRFVENSCASAQSEACDVSMTLSIQAAALTTWP
jgi:hypothetical protein